ncbi:MAG: hypothetical protein M1831_004769 [Alyxoria varia]|nr:MAG: hypothetical protein M1831_004769 [Alyxoria varia]
MPKNPHPPRNGGPSKKSSQKGPSDADTQAKVGLSNAKKDTKKAGSATEPAGTNNKGKGKAKEGAANAPDVAQQEQEQQQQQQPKKPDTRTLIGGSSWTGKLPMNLMSEHCQKQHWEKPEYTLSKRADGFTSSVILRSKNPKTQEMTQLPAITLPLEQKHLALQPSAVEARHFAAAYALFRVSSMKNIHLAMPPKFRDLWKAEFQEMKKADQANAKGWKYAADPFQAHKEGEEIRAQIVKRQEQAEKDREKETAHSSGDGTIQPGKKDMRGWKTAPRVEMGKKIRRQVEDTVKRYGTWNPHGMKLSKVAKSSTVEELSAAGFRRSHVEEAVDLCKDREEALEWLLIHVPEDDLPSWAIPENYAAGVSMATGDLKREASIKRLAAGGYAFELCQETLDACNQDERKAAEELQNILLGRRSSAHTTNGEASESNTSTDNVDTWAEEQIVLDSIYGGRFKRIDEDTCRIRLDDVLPKNEIVLSLRKPVTGHYPHELPLLTVNANLPAYIRLSITRKALEEALSYLGEQMIFNLVDWLSREIPSIVQNPGSLAKVSGASNAAVLSSHTAGHETLAIRSRKQPTPRKAFNDSKVSAAILDQYNKRQAIPAQFRMTKARQALPAWSVQERIVSEIKSHQVVIVSGETGSGKSTQTLQFVLDDLIKRELGAAAKLVCTQPRRISALGLADRVAEERCVAVGGEVGYSIRGESKLGPDTRITFGTTGVLLRRLQTSGGSIEDVIASMADISHVFVDEVHERSLDTDFLLALLRDVSKRRKDLKIILMSATLDAGIFEKYFGGPNVVGRVEIQGRTFPVQDYYVDDVVRMTGFSNFEIEDDGEFIGQESKPGVSKAIQGLGMGINYQLIASLVKNIDLDLCDKPGGILIFLPGTLEIQRTLDALRSFPNLHALPLHASLLPSDQRRVFPPPPSGKRKVIASTNVAETSVTIPDIVAVIDTGRVKETRYDALAHMVKLEEVWASKAACKQRRGRAGRVTAGKCYKLFTRSAESKMAERPDPEIRRVPLEQLSLSVKAMGVDNVPSFLSNTLTPPESTAVEEALNLLKRMGALDGDTLTALGRHMAMIPTDLRCAKLMIFGALFGCLESCVTIAAILSLKSPFVSPTDKREESKMARQAFGENVGDPIVDLRAYDAWAEMRKTTSFRECRTWCERSFLSQQTLNDISSTRSQYLSSLQEVGFLPSNYFAHPSGSLQATSQSPSSKYLNRNSASLSLLHSLVLSALQPQILRITYPPQKYTSTSSGAIPIDPSAKEIKFFSTQNNRVFVHPSSTLFGAQTLPTAGGGTAPFLTYFNKVETSKVFARELCPAGTYALLLFGGDIAIDEEGRGLLVDRWARVVGWARIGVLVSRMRGVLDGILGKWIEEPGTMGRDLEWQAREKEQDAVVEVAKKLVELNGLDD